MKKVNWLDHLISLVVVILGISIAFYLEGARADNESIAQEKQYLQSIMKDIETDIASLDTLVAYNHVMSAALVTLSEASVGMTIPSDSALTSNVMMIQYNPPFVEQRITYESLKASGKIDLIDDFDLRNDIIQLYEQYYRGSNTYDNAISEHVRDFVKPFYVSKIQFKSPSHIDSDFLQLQEFRNIIFVYRYLFRDKNDFYLLVKNQASGMLERIHEYEESL